MNRVLTNNPHIQSRAAYVLLKRLYRRLDPPKHRKEWLTFRETTLSCWQRERGVLNCHYCNKGPLVILANNKHPMVATLDHVIPRARYGAEYDLSNLVVACYGCNQKKADKLTIE